MFFYLKKIITAFLLPPGLFVSVLALAAMVQAVRKQWRSASVALCLALLMWVLSIAPVSLFFHQKLMSGIETPADIRGDVIILLGGGVYERMPDLSGTGVPPESVLARITEAYRLYRRLEIPILVCGGPAPGETLSEASVTARFLMDFGVPENRILLEARSHDTYENARYAKEIIRRHRFQHPILVTSGYHLRRSMQAFKKFGVSVTPWPAGRRTWPGMTYTWQQYLPAGYSELSLALKEYLGLLFYRVYDR